MKITEDVRKYAAEQGVPDQEALQKGMDEKSREFTEKVRSYTQKHSIRSCRAAHSRPTKLFGEACDWCDGHLCRVQRTQAARPQAD